MIKTTRNNRNTIITPFFFITLLAVFSFLLKDYHLPIIPGYGVFLILAFVFIGLGRGRLNLSKTQIAAAILAIAATTMVFLPYARTVVSTVSIVMSLDIAMLYIMICHPTEADVKRTMRILMVFAVVMSIYALAVSVYPNIYYGFIKRIIPSDTQALIELGLRYHYGISVGGESIVVDYYAFFGLVISLNTLLLIKEKFKTRSRLITVFVVCALAIVVQNRKAELVTTLLVVAFLFLSNVNVTSLKQKWKQLLFFSIVGVVASVAFFYLLQNGYLGRYETFFAQLKSAAVNNTVDISSGRMKLWSRAFELFKEHPVFGIGWGNFYDHLTDTFNVFNDGQLSNVHNNYLQLLCETGVVGLVLFAGTMFYMLGRTFKCIRTLRNNLTDCYTARIAASTSLSFQLFFLGISFIDPVFYKMFTWPFYAIAMIFLVYAERKKSNI